MDNVDISNIEPYILAGGKSSRFGSDKRNIKINGINIVQRMIELLGDAFGKEPYVVGDNLGDIGLEIKNSLPDAAIDSGPLGGLVSILRFCPENWAFVIAADMPKIQKSDINRLIENIDVEHDILTLSRDGCPEPLTAIYHKRTEKFWSNRLMQNKLHLGKGIIEYGWKPVMISEKSDALENINYESDL